MTSHPIRLAYGEDVVESQLGWGRMLGVLDIADVPGLPDPAAAIRRAIEDPIGLDAPLRRIVQAASRVTILVSDSFRTTRADLMLPAILSCLNDAGIPDEAITILFATGTHRAPTPGEQEAILGPAVHPRFRGRIHVHNPHDPAAVVRVGTTSRGTPVEVNRLAVECDCLIATGAVVLHYFGGFGGGRKSILPGICSVEAIAHNHAMNLHPSEDRLDPAVRIGELDGNPVAEDMLEAARLVGVDFIVNTVLNRHGAIARVFAGHLDAAHRAAAAYARELYAVSIPQRADLVVASSGGTRNFVQTHKALYNSYQALKPGGRIVLLARCPEGLGGEQFAQWLRLGSREAVIAELRRHSEINGQTALSTIEKGPSALLVTEMAEADVALLKARKAPGLDAALALARRELAAAGAPEPTVYLMPSAAYTVPFPRG
ncbi:MAG: nickel-dependent lactate racemase [Candidatus Hydrogenedentes bacterium]|nr:nickel-dependent lactate racemase [Candidatus Hydrogenedentota bacterium]